MKSRKNVCIFLRIKSHEKVSFHTNLATQKRTKYAEIFYKYLHELSVGLCLQQRVAKTGVLQYLK